MSWEAQVELEAGYPLDLGVGSVYPYALVGLRINDSDVIDAQLVVDIGGGVRRADLDLGLSVSVEGRGQVSGPNEVAHGISVSAQYDWGSDQRGLQLQLSTDTGRPSELDPWSTEIDTGDPTLSLTGEMGYSIGSPRGRLITPYVGLGWRQDQSTTGEMGVRYRMFEGGLQLELSGEHRQNDSQEDGWRYRYGLSWNF